MAKSKYTVDLAGHMAECEANYARIMKLIPDMQSVDEREFAVDALVVEPVHCRITVLERCKYTTMVEISQRPMAATNQHLPSAITFSLRVYHDAQMVEVAAFDKHRLIRAKYDYPNVKMYQPDEKIQLNQHLGEWLSYCLKYGRELETVLVP